MSRPALRPKTTILQFRKKVPKDILKVARGKSLGFKIDDFLVNATLGSEITFSLRTRDPHTAKLRHAQALVQLEGHLKAIRTGPQPLTKRDRVAISGLLYRAFADHLEADPGDPEIWQKVQEANDYALNGQPLTIDTFPGEGRIRLLEERFGGLVDLILARQGIVTDARSRMLLLTDAGQALTDAGSWGSEACRSSWHGKAIRTKQQHDWLKVPGCGR
jgi:hypothetical protein